MNGHDPEPGAPDKRAKSRELFESAVEQLDTATSNRLRLMRRHAQSAPAATGTRWLLPTGAAAVALLALTLAWWQPRGAEPVAGTAAVTAAATGDQFPSEDDAELYAWLGEAPVATDDAQGDAL